MIKKYIYIFLIIIIIVVVYFISIASRKRHIVFNKDNTALQPPPVQLPNKSPEVLAETTSSGSGDFEEYKNQHLNFTILLPKIFEVKSLGEGVIISKKDTSQKDTALIKILRRDLKVNEIINTVAEVDINKKLQDESMNTTVLETITPIAIGSNTAITYKLRESLEENTYYYVPQAGNKVLEVSTLGENSLTPAELSMVDLVVYSITTQ